LITGYEKVDTYQQFWNQSVTSILQRSANSIAR